MALPFNPHFTVDVRMEVAYVACAHQIRIAQVRLQLNSSAETVKIIGHVSSCLV